MKKIILGLILLIMGAAIGVVAVKGNEWFGGKAEYSITLSNCDNGVITVNKTSAKEGEDIVITAVAQDGYKLSYIIVDGQILDDSTFKMPKKDVTIDALFNAIATGTETPIDFKTGIYTCKGSTYIGDSNNDHYNEYREVRKYFYNILTFNDNNTVNYYNIYNKMNISNIAFTRNGNKLNATVSKSTVSVDIIDETTLVLNDGYDIQLFTYAVDFKVNEGNYNSTASFNTSGFPTPDWKNFEFTVKLGNKIDISLYNDDISDGLVYTDVEYKIYGDRFFIYTGEYTCAGKLRRHLSYPISECFIIEEIVVFSNIDDSTYRFDVIESVSKLCSPVTTA